MAQVGTTPDGEETSYEVTTNGGASHEATTNGGASHEATTNGGKETSDDATTNEKVCSVLVRAFFYGRISPYCV